jgi:hypothetical protein
MTFRNLDLFPVSGDGRHQSRCLPHLRTETDPVSEMSCFSSNYLESGRWTKSENPVIVQNFVWKTLMEETTLETLA